MGDSSDATILLPGDVGVVRTEAAKRTKHNWIAVQHDVEREAYLGWTSGRLFRQRDPCRGGGEPRAVV